MLEHYIHFINNKNIPVLVIVINNDDVIITVAEIGVRGRGDKYQP